MELIVDRGRRVPVEELSSGTAARLFKPSPRNDTHKENLRRFGNLAA